MHETHASKYRLYFALTVALILVAPAARAGDVEVDGTFVSTVGTGTPPLAVSSTTKVDDLNADLLDSLDSSDLFTTATDGSGSGLDADLLDGLEASAFARSLGNVVRVGETGGDFTSIQSALDSITDASASNPYLVLVGPGVYSERVAMKPFVDVQGSGEGVTKITQSGSTDPDFGTVAGADDAELRFLTVENTGGSDGVIGVYNVDVSPRLVHVTVEVDGSDSLVYGAFNEATDGVPSAPEFEHVTVRVEGTNNVLGFLNQTEADSRMADVLVSVDGSGSGAKYGLFNVDAVPVLHGVEVDAASSEATASVFGVVNQDVPAGNLSSLRVSVSGGGTRYGVNNTRSDLTIRDLEVEVSGDADTSYGVYHEDSTVVVESCSVEVAGGSGGSSFSVGVRSFDSSGELRDCSVEVDGGSGTEQALDGFDSTGLGSYTFDVHHSTLSAPDSAIDGSSTFAMRVGASQLDGGVSGSASYTCVHAYDGSFVELTTACALASP